MRALTAHAWTPTSFLLTKFMLLELHCMVAAFCATNPIDSGCAHNAVRAYVPPHYLLFTVHPATTLSAWLHSVDCKALRVCVGRKATFVPDIRAQLACYASRLCVL